MAAPRSPVGRNSFVGIADFFRLTALTRRDVDDMVSDGPLRVVFTRTGELAGVLVDTLPTRDELVGRGLSPRSGYAEALAAAVRAEPSEAGLADVNPASGEADWSMRW